MIYQCYGWHGFDAPLSLHAGIVMCKAKTLFLISPQKYIDIWKVSNSKNAEKTYLSKINYGDTVEKLYGLIGLKIINSDAFRGKAKELMKITEHVKYGPYGCILYLLPVKEIVDNIIERDLVDPKLKL